ncbi:hypothetical protein E4T39_07802 [Aureobasidium subglaciale]|nr:hypothetical protein E4T39_07802 [Aureobasidium subglaciale]
MNIRNWESRNTLQIWGTGSGSPSLMILTSLVVNTVALLVLVIVNTTVVDDGSNDYGEGTPLGTDRCGNLSLLGLTSDLLPHRGELFDGV